MESLQYTSLSDQAYENLKKQITERHLEAGAKLDIKKIAKEFGVSRGPVSEAFIRLESEGLIERKNRVGTFVTPITRKNVNEMFDAREMLECCATNHIANNIRSDDVTYLEQQLNKCKDVLNIEREEDFDYLKFSHCDRNFHTYLINLSDNSLITQFYESLNSHVQIACVYAKPALQRSKEGQQEHRKILNAFKAGEVEKALKTQREHLHRSKEEILSLMSDNVVI